MSDDFDVRALGRRVRSLRLATGLTVDAVARRAGVSRSMVAAVEAGEKAPTVLTLHRIANGLGTNMTRLLGEEAMGDVIVLRQGDQRVVRDPAGWERRNLTPVLPDSTFEFMRTTIPAGVDAGVFPPHRSGTWEVVAVEAGTLRLTIDGAPWTLSAGDSVSYRGNVPHQFANPGEDDCIYYLTLHHGDMVRPGDPGDTGPVDSDTVSSDDEDPLQYQAVEAISDQHWITGRFLERRFAIGSDRARRMLRAMERERLVTPADIPSHLVP